MIITSKVAPRVTWRIKQQEPISADDVAYIETFNPAIYCNDLTGVLWTFDVKLPSGVWLENITFTNDMTQANAFIF